MGVIKRIRRNTTTDEKKNTPTVTAKVINYTTTKNTTDNTNKNKTIARRGNTTTVKTNSNKNKTSTSRDKWKNENLVVKWQSVWGSNGGQNNGSWRREKECCAEMLNFYCVLVKKVIIYKLFCFHPDFMTGKVQLK